MTKLLQQAIAQIQQLPPEQQDAIASRFLDELKDEQKWEASFAATTKQVSQKQPIYSARVSLNYRALGLLESEHIYWYWIGAHDEYDELLKRM